MAPFGVKVLCIEPGFFKTNVTDSTIQINNVQALWDRLPQDVKDDYGIDYLEKGNLQITVLLFMCSLNSVFYTCY